MEVANIDKATTPSNIYLSTIAAEEQVPQTQEVPANDYTRGCGINCQCERCKELGYTAALELESPDVTLFQGAIMVKQPVSHFHLLLGHVIIDYRAFHKYPFIQMTKLKATHADDMLGLKRLYICDKTLERKEEVLVNMDELGQWFANIVRAKLYTSNRVGIPQYLFEGKMIGTLLVRTFMGGWRKTGAEITDRLRFEGDKDIRVIKEFWTRFEIIDVEGLCLVVKFWDFLTKWELGIPLRDLSRWLYAFMTLIKD